MNSHLIKLLSILLCSSVLNSYATTPPAQLPQTGQTVSYGAGDDGALQKGTYGTTAAGRFVPAKQSDGNDCSDALTDQQTGLMWVKSPSTTLVDWPTAINNAAATNYCGYTDWRLPNRNELRSLINYGQADLALWLNDTAQGFNNVQQYYYWSSSTIANTTSAAWNVFFASGTVIADYKTNLGNVWPVRGGQ